MAILVTGGAGFIGTHTCIELINAGYEPIVVDNYYNASPKALERVEEIVGKKVKFYECDVRDKKKLDSVFKENKIDAVIHFAGLKAVGESCHKPLEYYDNNIGGTLALCEVMRDNGCKKIVFSSSATVYGMNNVSPLTEDMKTGGTTNPYGTTKYMIEIILEDLYKADNSWDVTLLRYFNPIGAHKSVEQLKSSNGGVRIYNLGTGKGYSVLDIVKAFEKATGVKINYKIAPRRDGDIATCYSDPSKAKKELGWEAKRDLEEMCEDSWRWQKNNPNGFDD